MNFVFTNGTATQKARWEESVERFLNLPENALPLQIEVTFVDPSTLVGHGHTDLAVTTWTYGDTESTCQVRNDAPNFGSQEAALRAEAAALGLEYNPDRFYAETSAHETGHSAFASLPENRRVAIARMFGAESDDIEELQPAGKPWQDHIMEAIAETFKEAFLPRRYRVFANRTNIKIPYSKFPEFRALFRAGVEESTGEGTPVPAYNLDVYRQRVITEPAGIDIWLPEAEGEGFFFEGSFFQGTTAGGLYTPRESWEPPAEADDNTLYKWFDSQSATETLLVPHGTHFAGAVEAPQAVEFFGPSLDFAEEIHGSHYGEGGFAGAFTWAELNANPELEPPGPGGPFEFPFPEKIMGVVALHMWFTYWKPSTEKWVCWDYRSGSILGFEPLYRFGNPHPKFPGPTAEHSGCWVIMKGDGRFGSTNEGDTWSIPIGTVSLGSDVPSFAPTISTCGGEMVQVRIFAKMTFKTSVSRQDSLATIQARLPSFTLSRGEKPCKGGEIVLPQPQLTPSGGNSEARPHRRPVVGNFG